MDFYLKTDCGKKRSQNEDALSAEDVPVGGLPNLFVVADGMGGYKGGDFASKRAIEIILASLRATEEKEPVTALRQAISDANLKIYEEGVSNPERKGMGTTVVCATIRDGVMTVANVGDSRLYLARNGTLTQVTHDHSYVNEMVERGRISPRAASTHPKKHVITRAIGAEETVRIDFFEEELGEGDRILLCSDGLSNMVPDEDIAGILDRSASARRAGEDLVDLANQNGGADNISAIVIAV